MMTSACITCREYGVDAPIGLVAGDIGKRKGSEAIYNYLVDHLPEMGAKVMTLHYVMPDLKLNKKVLATIDTMEHKPMMIADAGSMYVAKAGAMPIITMCSPRTWERPLFWPMIRPTIPVSPEALSSIWKRTCLS